MDRDKDLCDGNFHIGWQRISDDLDRRIVGDSIGDNPKLQRFDGKCLHNTGTLEIDESRRTVTCTTCGHILDNFQALLVLCYNRQDMERQIRVLEALEKNLQERDTAKKKRCKHKHATILADGSRYCPSCQLLEKDYIKLNEGGE